MCAHVSMRMRVRVRAQVARRYLQSTASSIDKRQDVFALQQRVAMSGKVPSGATSKGLIQLCYAYIEQDLCARCTTKGFLRCKRLFTHAWKDLECGASMLRYSGDQDGSTSAAFQVSFLWLGRWRCWCW